MKLLIVEDEQDLADNVSSYLSREGTVCETAYSFQEAEDRLLSFEYDIVLLDIMLPDGNGLNILKVLKQIRPETGVLIISAKNALDDKVNGLELGADDYLTKPFHLPELNARLNAIYRRRKFQGQKTIEFQDIVINPETHDVTVCDKPLVLTLKEYELLLFFVTNKNRVLTKQSIAEHLWGDNVDFLDSFDFVYQHIKNLRKKITAEGGADNIKTIYGLGYKLSES
ncbi:MAG TPA: response regulator transcription factor [Flavilitoribacter sp.]|nr:response regulator transcription factor [Flavilitoribacter sp.]HMQ87577.1 response regulator transcription factor [Flavilitoribacter sp.]